MNRTRSDARRVLVQTLRLVVALVTVGGCGSRVCVPGATQICSGVGACVGAQACLAEGQGYSACACDENAKGGGGQTADAGPAVDAGQAVQMTRCQIRISPFFARYDLVIPTVPNSEQGCGQYSGDLIQARWVDGGVFTIEANEMATVTGLRNIDGGLVRVDPTDPTRRKASAIGFFDPGFVGDGGICQATLADADQNLPAAYQSFSDGGSSILPATHITYAWSGFRTINTSRFPGTAFSATVEVTVNTCRATYKLTAIAPATRCLGNPDCSAFDSAFAATCNVSAGYCMPTASFESLLSE